MMEFMGLRAEMPNKFKRCYYITKRGQCNTYKVPFYTESIFQPLLYTLEKSTYFKNQIVDNTQIKVDTLKNKVV